MNTEDFNAEDVMYLLPTEDPLLIEATKSFRYNQVKKSLQYAIERVVDLSPEFNGGWVETETMDIWRVHIISPDALSLGVLFSEYELSEGVRIFLYDESGKHIKGAFTHKNNKDFGSLFVSHIPGEQVIIEMQVDKETTDYGKLRIGSVSHAVIPLFGTKKQTNSGLGESQDCEIDINCEEGEEWQTIKKSVCLITTPRLYCTGILVNNTSYNGKPYVLTAEHCLNADYYANNSTFTFRFENSACFINDAVADKSISGADVISTGDTIDFTLLKLSETPPRAYELYFAGWDVREKTYESSVTLHHPNADAMKISYDFDTQYTPEEVPGDLNDYLVPSNYWIKQWDIGTTEGGSSGSPLFNPNKRLIGLLSGGLAYCGDSIGYNEETGHTIFSSYNSVLDKYNKNDYYSRLYYSWDYHEDSDKQLKRWLDPTNTGQLSIGGLSQMALDVNPVAIPANDILVYPNPSEGHFILALPDNNYTELNIEIYNISGKLVYKEKRPSHPQINMNLNHLHSGMYFMKVRSDNFNGSSRIIIKK